MVTSYTIPPNNRASGNAGHIGDHNNMSNALTAALKEAMWPSLYLAPSGATAETFPRMLANDDTSTLVSGTLYVSAMPMAEGVTLANLSALVHSTTASGVTHGWYALLDSGLVVRSVSADETSGSGVWGSTYSEATLAVSSYVTPAPGLYYFGVCIVASSMPALVSADTAVTAIAQTPILTGSSGTSLSTPPTVGSTMASLSGASGFHFYGYSS